MEKNKKLFKIVGFYGIYYVTEEKARKYYEFMKTKEYKKFKESCAYEMQQYNENFNELRKGYGLYQGKKNERL